MFDIAKTVISIFASVNISNPFARRQHDIRL